MKKSLFVAFFSVLSLVSSAQAARQPISVSRGVGRYVGGSINQLMSSRHRLELEAARVCGGADKVHGIYDVKITVSLSMLGNYGETDCSLDVCGSYPRSEATATVYCED